MVAQRQTPIVIHAVVGEDRRLIIDLPSNTPIGSVTVMVASTESEAVPESPATPVNTERERLRAILLAAGKLGTAHMPLPGTKRPSDEEIRQAGVLPAGVRPSEDIIRELRDDD